MPDAISLRGVTKSFGSTVAVRDLDLVVPEGALYGVIGPNGAGKTMTIRMILSILFLLIFFVLAFLTVAALMAAIGSAVNEMREAQTLMTPVTLLARALAPCFVGLNLISQGTFHR